MTTDELLELYEKHEDDFLRDCTYLAIWADDVDKDICVLLSKALNLLARKGYKKAAAMYGAIAVYDNNEKCFDKDEAMELIFKTDALNEYTALISEQFERIVDEDVYLFFSSAPSIWLAKSLTRKE